MNHMTSCARCESFRMEIKQCPVCGYEEREINYPPEVLEFFARRTLHPEWFDADGNWIGEPKTLKDIIKRKTKE